MNQPLTYTDITDIEVKPMLLERPPGNKNTSKTKVQINDSGPGYDYFGLIFKFTLKPKILSNPVKGQFINKMMSKEQQVKIYYPFSDFKFFEELNQMIHDYTQEGVTIQDILNWRKRNTNSQWKNVSGSKVELYKTEFKIGDCIRFKTNYSGKIKEFIPYKIKNKEKQVGGIVVEDKDIKDLLRNKKKKLYLLLFGDENELKPVDYKFKEKINLTSDEDLIKIDDEFCGNNTNNLTKKDDVFNVVKKIYLKKFNKNEKDLIYNVFINFLYKKFETLKNFYKNYEKFVKNEKGIIVYTNNGKKAKRYVTNENQLKGKYIYIYNLLNQKVPLSKNNIVLNQIKDEVKVLIKDQLSKVEYILNILKTKKEDIVPTPISGIDKEAQLIKTIKNKVEKIENNTSNILLLNINDNYLNKALEELNKIPHEVRINKKYKNINNEISALKKIIEKYKKKK